MTRPPSPTDAGSEAFYHMVLENLDERVFVKDLHGRYIFLNRACCAFWGLSRNDALGRNDRQIHSESTARRCTQGDQFVLRKKTTYYGEERIRTRKGRERIMEVIKAPLMDSDGELIGLVGILRDITEKKQTEMERIETERRLRFLSSCLLRAQETERNRLAKELHDELGQSLAMLKHMLRSTTRTSNQPEANPVDEAIGYIDTIIENLRRISRDLSPSTLEDLGLAASLKWLIDNFTRKHTIQATVDMIDVDALFSPDVKIHLYRIVQESLTNIAKHARAAHIRFSITRKPDHRVAVCIADDGRGFDPSGQSRGLRPDSGMGLDILAERAHMIDARLQVDSRRGGGTTITLEIPASAPWRIRPPRKPPGPA